MSRRRKTTTDRTQHATTHLTTLTSRRGIAIRATGRRRVGERFVILPDALKHKMAFWQQTIAENTLQSLHVLATHEPRATTSTLPHRLCGRCVRRGYNCLQRRDNINIIRGTGTAGFEQPALQIQLAKLAKLSKGVYFDQSDLVTAQGKICQSTQA